jgi:hypothetical protein
MAQDPLTFQLQILAVIKNNYWKNLRFSGVLHGVRRRVIPQKIADYINIAAEAWNQDE